MAGEIVLGYDDTDEAKAALPVVVDLARSTGTGLVVCFGFEPPRSGGEVGALRDEIEKLGEEFVAAAVTRIREIDPTLSVEVQLVQDRPADTIVRVADATAASFIVLGHRQRHLIAEVFVESVLESVMSDTTRPIVVVQSPDED